MGAVTGTEVEEVDVVAVVCAGSDGEVIVDSDGKLSPGLVPYS